MDVRQGRSCLPGRSLLLPGGTAGRTPRREESARRCYLWVPGTPDPWALGPLPTQSFDLWNLDFGQSGQCSVPEGSVPGTGGRQELAVVHRRSYMSVARVRFSDCQAPAPGALAPE